MSVTKDSALSWGIIGAGDVVINKSGPSLVCAERSEITAIMGRRSNATRRLALCLGAQFWTTDVDGVLNNHDIDIVYIATPPNSHMKYVRAVSAAGKHVLVEKPMAMNEIEGRQMIALCEDAGVKLFVAYYRRFQPHVVHMRKVLADNVIGRPVFGVVDLASSSIASRLSQGKREWRDDDRIASGGTLIDIGSHRIDLMIWLLGPFVSIQSVALSHYPDLEVEQTATIVVEMTSGSLCSITGDFYTGRDADRFLIRGEEGLLIADPLDGHALSIHTENGKQERRFEPLSYSHLGLVRHIESVLIDGKTNEVSGYDGIATEIVLDRVRGQAIRI